MSNIVESKGKQYFSYRQVYFTFDIKKNILIFE